MDISVIIVTYNQEHTIGRAIESVLNQDTEATYEIVIGDDCSNDGTEAVCRDYATRFPDKIRYIRRTQNLGLQQNYYDCIAMARGRYLADCAGDDYWVDSLKLQRQFETLESRPDVSLVAGRWLCQDVATGRLSEEPKAISPGEYAPGSLLEPLISHQTILHLCTAMYRKSIIERGVSESRQLFLDPLFPCEDFQIILACAAEGTIVVLPEIMLHYSVGHTSVSNPRELADMYRYAYYDMRMTLRLQRHYMPDPDSRQAHTLKTYYRKSHDFLAAIAFKTTKKDIPEFREITDCKDNILFNKEYMGAKSHIYRMMWFLKGRNFHKTDKDV